MIGIASDHAGFQLKEALKAHLQKQNTDVVDFGPQNTTSVAYPLYAQKVCTALRHKQISTGILICGSGIGMSIAANRFQGIRAALCLTPEMAHLARAHNDANVLVLGARLTQTPNALEIATIFLTHSFEEGRHTDRLNLIEEFS